ncbi:MAG: hypothetical protein ABJA61_03910 [Caldimonas sp.]
MNLTISGLPAFAISIGFILVFAAPVWLAARVVGADHPTLLRSVAALILGFIGAFISIVVTGAFALLLAPLAFLVSFKTVLGTSVLGTIVLSVIVTLAYVVMVKLVGHGFSLTGKGVDA